MRSKRLKFAAGGISLLALGISNALHAQEAPAGEDTKTLDTIMVTGTNIRGATPAGNSVLTIGAEEIAASGKATIGDYLRDLPANFAGGVGMSDNIQGTDSSVGGANMTGGQGVNLRGLGALSTLVLVNGRRVAAAGQLGDFVDISTIPTSAVSHIEVVLDGASAVYGSDAVGGVVNIILKRSDDGARTSLRVGSTGDGASTQVQLGQSWGKQWDGGGLIVGYEYNQQDNVLANDLHIYRNGSDFSSRGGVNWRRFGARAGAAANQFNGAASGSGVVTRRVSGGGLVAVTDGVGNTHDAWDMVDLLPETDRQSVFFGFEHGIGESTELYGDLRYSRRRGTYNQGYQALYGTLGPTNPHFIAGIPNNYGVLIDDRPLQRDVGVDSLAATIGAGFALGGSWRGEATLSYSREKQFRNGDVQRNANIYDYLATPAGGKVQAPTAIQCSQGLPANASPAQKAYCTSLNYTPFNPWTTAALPEQVLSQLIGFEDLRFNSWLAQASFKVDGDLFQMGGGTAKLAAGVDWRRENIGGELDFNWRSTSDQHETFGTTERDVGALFAELAFPLIGKDNASAFAKKLDVSIAGRYERSSGLGDFSTFNPKIGIDYKPTDGLTLRGSWGTSFHAPPMRYAYNGVQPIQGGNGAFLRADLYRAPCNTTVVPLNGVSNTAAGCTFTAIVISGGAGPTLRPEEARTWTLGFDWQPTWAPGLRVAASYFDLEVDDRIVRIQAGQLGGILNDLFTKGGTPYIDSLEVNPDDARVQDIMDNDPRYLGQLGAGPVQSAAQVAMIVNATQLNLASLRIDGVDFDLSYGFELSGGGGSVELFTRGTWLNSYEIQATPGSGYVDRLGKYSPADGPSPVPLRSMQGVRWRYGDLDAALTMNYVDDYECNAGCFVPNAAGLPVAATSPVKVKAWKTFDFNINYDLSRIGGFFEGARVGFTAVNFTNGNPPFFDTGTNAVVDTLPDPYDPANATALGRTLVLSFEKRW
ncbi:TonB-dependent receptor [Thermomonas brevis]